MGVALFPQPCSQTAADNLRVSVTQADEIVDLAHWSLLPYALRRFGGVARPAPEPFVMPPGGAIPRGCLGFLSAGLELSLQIDAGVALSTGCGWVRPFTRTVGRPKRPRPG